MRADDPLSQVHLPRALEPVRLSTCDSALAEAARRARVGAPEGTFVWVGRQTNACGRLGSRWRAPSGGLHCALVLRPNLEPAHAAAFITLATVALGTAMAGLVQPMTDLRYRWPNAVILGGGRAAGAWLASGHDWLVLAASANVLTAGDSAGVPRACIRLDGGNPAATVAGMLEAFARQLVTEVTRWDDEGLVPALRHFRSRGPRKGDAVTLCLSSSERVTGRFVVIDDDGALTLQTGDGRRTIGISEYMGAPVA